MRLLVKNQINDGSPVESAITMARFSIVEDDDDTPLANKRPRFAEPASQSQPRPQRSVPSQPPVVLDCPICLDPLSSSVFQAYRLHKLYKNWEDTPDIAFVVMKATLLSTSKFFNMCFILLYFLFSLFPHYLFLSKIFC